MKKMKKKNLKNIYIYYFYFVSTQYTSYKHFFCKLSALLYLPIYYFSRNYYSHFYCFGKILSVDFRANLSIGESVISDAIEGLSFDHLSRAVPRLDAKVTSITVSRICQRG